MKFKYLIENERFPSCLGLAEHLLGIYIGFGTIFVVKFGKGFMEYVGIGNSFKAKVGLNSYLCLIKENVSWVSNSFKISIRHAEPSVWYFIVRSLGVT